MAFKKRVKAKSISIKIVYIIFVIIFVVLGFFIGKLFLKNQKSNLPPPRIITVKEDLSKWQKFESKQLHFSFLYPAGKKLVETTNKDLSKIFLWRATIGSSEMALADLASKTLVKWSDQHLGLGAMQKKFKEAKIPAPLIEYIKLNEREGIRIHFLNTPLSSVGLDTILNVGRGKIFLVSTSFKNKTQDSKATLESLKEHNNILASFQFSD